MPARAERGESWPQESEQGDKWGFCLTAGKIGPRIRRDDEQTSPPEPHTSTDHPDPAQAQTEQASVVAETEAARGLGRRDLEGEQEAG